MKNPFWYLDGISVGGCSVIRCHLVFLHVLIVIPLEQVGAAAADHVEKQESIHADTDNYADGTARQTGFFAVPLMRPAPRLKRAKITPSEPKNREPMLSMNKGADRHDHRSGRKACEPVLRGGCTGGCCW